MRGRGTLALAGVLLALGTALGALGAHALPARLPAERLASYQTAVSYHIFNALGLLALGITARWLRSPLLTWSTVLVAGGIALFSGSIYAITFGAPRALGMVTPFGGMALMAGWTLFAIAAWRGWKRGFGG